MSLLVQLHWLIAAERKEVALTLPSMCEVNNLIRAAGGWAEQQQCGAHMTNDSPGIQSQSHGLLVLLYDHNTTREPGSCSRSRIAQENFNLLVFKTSFVGSKPLIQNYERCSASITPGPCS